jgi:hypothetical protein
MPKNTSQSVYIILFIWSLMHAFPHCQYLGVTARIQSLAMREGAAGPRTLPAPVCDGRRFIKLGLRKNSLRQLKIY